MKIFTDTSTLYAPQEAEKLGFKVLPLSVSVNGKVLGTGEGKSKKEAEQAAAQKALEVLQS